ncbi:MAG TPA: efflux transporter outer membrane subunit [Dyella sp.]|uniref:efflux transporter outer membrane subunit n=1 Tax=Dyella sp. TaxID=1869338 RepID=UPI002F95C873
MKTLRKFIEEAELPAEATSVATAEPVHKSEGPLKPLLRRSVSLPRALLPALIVIFLSACTVGPDYVRAPSIVGGSYVHAEQLQEHNQTREPAPLDTWWKGFDDPVLEQIVERAVAQNLDVAAAMARIEQARAAARGANAARLPQGEFNAQVAREYQSLNSALGEVGSTLPGYKRTQTQQDIGAGASWELDLAGGLKRDAQAAQAEYQAAEASGAAVRISVAAEAADAYFKVRGAQERIALAEQQVQTEQNLLELVRVRLAGGVGTDREVAQAEAILQQARASLPPLRAERDRQLNRLDVLMGAQPGSGAKQLLDRPASYAIPAIAAESDPAALLRRRPDVIAAERRVAASNERIGSALSEYYPKLSLGALLGFETLRGGTLFDSGSFQPAGVVGLRWRLFDFGRVDAEVGRSRGAEAEALANYRQSMLRATEDVENAIVTLSELENEQAILSREVSAHQRARSSAEDAYKGGAVSLLEVLDEDRQLLASRDRLAQTRADDARAAVAAFRALGGGWAGAADKLAER